MTHFAALNPLIALLIGIGWLIVKALQTRRKDADAWGELEQPPVIPPQTPSRPGTIGRTTQRREAAPPVPPRRMTQTTSQYRPVIIQPRAPSAVELAALKESEELHARAQSLDKAVASRLAAIEQETKTAAPAAPKPRARPAVSAHILRTMRNPVTVRQAFLASFVLNPPKALE
jgi:hypothetical protein